MNESDANILLTVMQYTIQVLVMYWFICKMVGIYKGADSFIKWLKKWREKMRAISRIEIKVNE